MNRRHRPSRQAEAVERGVNWINVILGRPLATNEQEDVKIGVVAGVPAMGLDGLTSSAYGPEAA